MAFEGPFAVLSIPLLLREEGAEGVNLSLQDNHAARRERSRAAVEMLLEAYARASETPPEVQRDLRRLVAYHLGLEARLAAEDGNLGFARRRAWESLAFYLGGRTAIRCLAGLAVPRVMAIHRPRRSSIRAAG
jgi:hypothetical protein